MAWLSDSRVRVVPEPSQVDLDSRSDQARDGASFSRQNEHYREERENCRQTPKNLHPLTRPLWCGAWAYSPVQVLGPAFVAAGEAQQLSPRIW
jgi:hypothetical protein